MTALPTTAIGNRNAGLSDANTSLVGTEPVLELIASADDADFVQMVGNQTITAVAAFELGDMPGDFGTMDTLAVQLRYAWATTPNGLLTWNNLTVQVVDSAGTALTNVHQVAGNITTTTKTNSAVIPLNTGLNTTANKATWDGAVVLVRFQTTRSMGGDGTANPAVYAGEITGTYTEAAATPVDVTAAHGIVLGHEAVASADLPVITLENTFEGGSDETAITTANSGGASGDAFDSVTSGASTVVYDTARAAHGSMSARFDIVSSTVFATWLEDAFTTAFFRTYLWAAASPSSAMTILRLRNGTTLVGRVQLNTSGQIAITNAAATIQAVGSTVITDGTWWRVEAKYIAGTTTGSVEVRIFAGDSTTATETITASATDFGTQATEISWGMSFAPSTTYVYWLDDVAYGTIDWIGPSAPSPTFVEIDVAHGLVLGHAATANVFPPVVRPFHEDFEGETDGTAITVGNTNFTRIDTGESELSPGTLEFDTADAAAGSGSGLFTALTTDSSQAYGVFFLDDGPIQFLRFYMKPVTAGPITSLIVQLKGRGGTIDPGGGPSEDPPLPDGVIGGQLAITAGRQIRLRDQSGTNVDGTGMAALPVGEWARVEMMADTTNDVLEVRQFTGANVHGTTPSDSRQFTSYTFVPDTPGWYYGQVGLIHFNNGWTAAFDEPETSAVDWLGPVVTPVDVAVAHGIALGHSAVAGLQADVVVAQGLAVGHMGTVAATATVVATHGLALGQSAAAAAATVAAVAHGIAFDETAVAAGGATVVDVAHGLLLGHAAAATVASEGVAATATSGIAVGHVATAAAGTGAAVHHGVALGSSAVAAARIAAVVSQGLTVAHSASGERAATTAQAVHGLTVGEAAELDVGAAGVVAVHGVAVGQSAVVGLHAGADVAHGLVLGASAAAAAQVRAAAAHGVAFTHAAQVTHGDVVSAQVAHGLELSHQAAAFEQPAARAAHGLVLGHAAQAGAQVAAVAAHGLAVGGQVQVFHGAGVAAQVVHGLVVGHASQAVATFTVAASHGVVLGHATVAAVILDVFAQVAHGLALGQVVSGRVGADTVLPVVAHARFGGPAVANGVYRPAGGGGSTGPAVVSGRT